MNLTALYLLAFAGALVTTVLALPMWRRWCVRTGLMDDPGDRKIHAEPVPLAGGLAVMTGLIVPSLFAAIALWVQQRGIGTQQGQPGIVTHYWSYLLPVDARLQELLAYGFSRRSLELAAIFLGALGMLAVGILDDKLELRPAVKFSSQFAVALLVAAAGVRITLFVPSVIFSYAVTVLWILTVINAFNFMDNMNGLCAGLGAIGAGFFATAAGAAGQYLVALIASLTCGALIGFLPYNFPRARSFLGDAGSHLVGFLLAVLAILPHFSTAKAPNAWAVLTPLLFLAVPLGDLVWVVLLRWRLGQPFYVGDNNHLSHRLVRRGLSRTQAVLLIWCLAIAVGALAFL